MEPDCAVTRTIDLPVEPDEAWTAITGEGLADWMGGDVRVDRHPGGTIEFDDPRGVTRWGVIEEWEAPRVVRFRWHDRDGDRGATTVEFSLDPLPSGTRLTIVETLPDGWPSMSAVSSVTTTTALRRHPQARAAA